MIVAYKELYLSILFSLKLLKKGIRGLIEVLYSGSFLKWGHLVDRHRIADRRSNLGRSRDMWCNRGYYLHQLRAIRRTLGSTTYNSLMLRPAPTSQFVSQAVVQRNTLMQSCYWKSTGTLLSAKKVIIICFRIFLLTRCLALTPWPKLQLSPVWRPWSSPSCQCSYATQQPTFFTDAELPLDCTGGNISTRVIVCKGLTNRTIQTYCTGLGWCFSLLQFRWETIPRSGYYVTFRLQAIWTWCLY